MVRRQKSDFIGVRFTHIFYYAFGILSSEHPPPSSDKKSGGSAAFIKSSPQGDTAKV